MKSCFEISSATGVAISMVAARLGGIIGNVVIATLLDLYVSSYHRMDFFYEILIKQLFSCRYCPAPTFIVAVLLAGGGLLSLLLPNTTRTALS